MTTLERLKQRFLSDPDFQPTIKSIVFPNYKNIADGEELTFDFPLTLLIGKNGTNKSSILHALYGCPEGKSTGEYWFSTHTDPISNDRAAYFYRYIIPGTEIEAEVLKTRISKDTDADYWEPSRPLVKHGMKKMPDLTEDDPLIGRVKTRWKAIEKPILYLDFRGELSAFDKAFYKVNESSRPAHRDWLRKHSYALKEAILNQLDSRIYYRKQRIFINHTFTDAQLADVNSILGAEYVQVIYIQHDFYMSGSYSVYLKKGSSNNYSEAFAGSGETSIVRLVYALENAKAGSLVLLDEPETSLHIEAQYQLKDYILRKISEKKLQVVISTHSPFFATGLPDNAIKVLDTDPVSKKIKIINSAPAEESSFHLGYRKQNSEKINIVVEDKFAQALVEHVLQKHLSPSQRDQLVLSYYPGGASSLINLAAGESLRDSSRTYYLFDGDQQPNVPIPDPITIPEADNDNLKQLIKDLFGFAPNLYFDSNKPEQRPLHFRKFLSFTRNHFFYLPFNNPDDFLVDNHPIFEAQRSALDKKLALRTYFDAQIGSSGDVRALEMFVLQRLLLSQIAVDHSAFLAIKDILLKILSYPVTTTP